MFHENPHCLHPSGTCAATPFLSEIEKNQELIAIYQASINAMTARDLSSSTNRAQFELWHQGIENAQRNIVFTQIELEDVRRTPGILCAICPHK